MTLRHLLFATTCLLASCGGDDSHDPLDAGGADAGRGGSGLNPLGSFDPGFTPTSPNTPLSIEVTVSGETLGENGLPFQPVNPGDPQFVDGWSVTFEKYIVVVGNVRLSPNALASQDQSVISTPVATKAGPFVIDVHQLATNGFNGFVGADGEEPAGGCSSGTRRTTARRSTAARCTRSATTRCPPSTRRRRST